MDFLQKLYSDENFGIYLVAVIAVLVILFFIVLFFGKKDEAKSKKSKKEKEVLSPITSEPLGNSIENPISLNTPLNEPIVDDNLVNNAMPSDNLVSNNFGNSAVANDSLVSNNFASSIVTNDAPTLANDAPVVNSDPFLANQNTLVGNNLQVSEPFKEVSKEVPLEFTTPNLFNDESVSLKEQSVVPSLDEKPSNKEFDFDALANAISKELETMKDKKEEVKPVIEEKPFAFPSFESVSPDPVPSELVSEIKKEEPVKVPRPAVFSSVYVNRKDEEKIVKPQFELPKMADLPKKIEPSSEVLNTPSVLDNLEEESYQILK